MKKLRKPNDSQSESKKPRRRRATGRSIESIENQTISMAYDLAAKRIRNGTATAQEVTHFLKAGSVLAQLEKEKLEKENLLLLAKTEALKSQKKVEELYANAMIAFRKYNGQEEIDETED
jgi:hypothetical protein